ncbi:MAG: sensor histidine kinase, partial [Oscillospiraceae bacterium]|nr:sensor histidine kinase [Oscillospiraceae bacterium]
MKAWRRIFAAVIALAGAFFVAANLLLYHLNTPENGRPYRVEINRLALQIEQSGLESVDLSQCEFVGSVVKYGGDFYNSDSDYAIREINGELYRFDYSAKNDAGNTQMIAAVNAILAVMTAAVLGMLFYIRSKILRPFDRLT